MRGPSYGRLPIRLATGCGRRAMQAAALLLVAWVAALCAPGSNLPRSIHVSPSTKTLGAHRATQGLSRPSNPASLRASGIGGPYLHLRDGQKIATSYTGDQDAVSALANHQAQPLSMATADFDEDRMPDLASGYAVGDGGVVTIHRGNVNALWNYGPSAQTSDPPIFLPNARAFSVPEPPDFLAAGDFNADGHWDLVMAHRGGTALYFLAGDGHGGFAPAQKIALPGSVTAMATGDVNRADGLTDIAVGLSGEKQSQVLIFESPMGALRGQPEAFATPAAPTSIAIGHVDGSAMNDVAVAAGNQMLVIHARDRKLTLPDEDKATVQPAKITRQGFSYSISALAIGNFSGMGPTIAALDDSGTVHILEHQNVTGAAIPGGNGAAPALAVSGRGGKVQYFPAKMTPQLTAQVALRKKMAARVSVNSLEWISRGEITLPAGFSQSSAKLVTGRVTTSTLDDLLVTDSGNSKVHILSSAQQTTAATKANTVDALTQPATMQIAASLDSAQAPAAVLAMRVNKQPLSGIVSLQEGDPAPAQTAPYPENIFVVTNTQDSGPGSLRDAIDEANNLTPEAANIAFDIPASDPNCNATTHVCMIQPVIIDNPFFPAYLPALATTVTIDGYTQPGASPNTLATGNNAVVLIQIDGSLAGGNSGSGSGLIPAFAPVAVIRGIDFTNWEIGIDATGAAQYIEGNLIGTDPTGTVAASNTVGIYETAPNVTVGGTAPQARNIITANLIAGVGILLTAADSTFIGNYFNTDPTGSFTVESQGATSGAAISQNGSNVIGGVSAGDGNLIVGSLDISFVTGAQGSGSNNLVQGNLIGTNAAGSAGLILTIQDSGATLALGDVYITDAGNSNTIGGTTPAARNIISGNGFNPGVALTAAAYSNIIEGNYIGTDITGTMPLPDDIGVYVGVDSNVPNEASAGANTIGGIVPGAGNLISGNRLDGIQMLGDTIVNANGVIAGDEVLGNMIGTDVTGGNPLGNGRNGIQVLALAGGAVTYSSFIGNLAGTAGNVIAFNRANGVLINVGNAAGNAALNNHVIGNSIYSNQGAGVMVASGTQNEISRNSIYSNGNLGIALGTGGANINTPCSSNPSSGGPNNLLNAPVLTSSGGTGTTYITATATDSLGDTSQFSNAIGVSGGTVSVAGTYTGVPNTTLTIEFFTSPVPDPSGYGQGQTYIGSQTVSTNASCAATISGNFTLTDADVGTTLELNLSPLLIGYVVGQYQYISAVTNSGALTAHNVVYTETLSSNLSIGTVTTPIGGCSVSGQTVTCMLGTVPVGQNISIVTDFLPIALGSSNSATVTASVTATEPDPNPANNTVTQTFPVSYYSPLIDHLSVGQLVLGESQPLTIYGEALLSVTTFTFNGSPLTGTLIQGQTCGSGFQKYTCPAFQTTIPASYLTTPGTATIVATNPAPGGGTGSTTINVPDNSSCTYMVTPNGTVAEPNAGAFLPFDVTASAQTCTWTMSSNVPWMAQEPLNGIPIIVFEGSSNGEAQMTVQANPGSARSGIITIAGQQVTVQQAGGYVCGAVDVTPNLENYTASGGTGTITINGGTKSCPWTIASDSSFLTMNINPAGTGGLILGYAVATDTGPSRTGHITITGPTNTAVFTVVQSGTGNPAPVINSLSPLNATQGSAPFTLGVIGTGFVNGSTVSLNGVSRATTFVNSGALTIALTSGDLSALGAVPVTVTSPGPGGGVSNAVNFTVVAPLVSIAVTPANPTITPTGEQMFTAIATYADGTTQNVTPRAMWQSQSTGVAQIGLYTGVANAVETGMTVITATLNGITSPPDTLTVGTSNTPTLVSIAVTPSSPTINVGVTQQFTATGTFSDGSTQNISSTANWGSTTQSVASVNSSGVATGITGGTTAITASLPGVVSPADTLTVDNLVPAITTLSQNSATAGGSQFLLNVTGTNFVSTSVVQWNGAALATTYNGTTSLTGTVPASDIASNGSATVTVFNPTPGGGTSNSLPFTINPATGNPVPTLTSLQPTSASAGGAAFTLTVNGTNFISSSTVQWKGTALATTFVSATQLTASVMAAEIATAGPAAITIANPSPGGGTSNALNFAVTDFSVSSAIGSQSVSPGNSATYTISASAVGGTYSGTVMFSVSGLPANANATFTPVSVSPGASSATSTLTVTTTGNSATSHLPTGAPWKKPLGPIVVLWLAIFAMASALIFRMQHTRKISRLLTARLALATMLICCAGFASACNGGFPAPETVQGAATGTPAGSYTLTVTGTSGSDSHSTTVTITVQ